MDGHHAIPGVSTDQLTSFNFSRPGPSSDVMEVFSKPSGSSLLEDIPDVEAYEHAFRMPRANISNTSHEYLPIHRDQTAVHQGVAYTQGRQNLEDDEDSSLTSPTGTGSSSKILQRSGIKMEIPPFLDPESTDDEPEKGVVYPEPDLFDVKNTIMTEFDLENLKLGKQAVADNRKKIEVPDASAPPNKIVEYLMFYRTLKENELAQLNAYRTKRNRLSLNLVKNNIDREFDQKACESLVKKLKDKKADLQNLIDVVISNGTKYLGCITIPRTLDGRLQVHGRKGFPHVVYGKLWRFSEMTKNETRHLDHCKHAFEMKSDLVCVNPYHYEIVVGSMIVPSVPRENHDHRDMPPPQTIPPRYHTPSHGGRRHSTEDVNRNPFVHIPQNTINMIQSSIPQQNILSGSMSTLFPMPSGISSSMAANISQAFNHGHFSSIVPSYEQAVRASINQFDTTVDQNINHGTNLAFHQVRPQHTAPTSGHATNQQGFQFNHNIEPLRHPMESPINSAISTLIGNRMNTIVSPMGSSNGFSVEPPGASAATFMPQFHQPNPQTLQMTNSSEGMDHHFIKQAAGYSSGVSNTNQKYFHRSKIDHSADVNPLSNFGAIGTADPSPFPVQSTTDIYAFDQPMLPPAELNEPSNLPAESISASFVNLSTFRRFCQKVFGSRWFDKIYDEPAAKEGHNFQFIETKRTPLLGVEIIRRRLQEGDELVGPLPEDAPYNDLCKFVLRLTAQKLVLTDDEPLPKEANEMWGTIVYYEGKNTVGERKCSRSDFQVDGGYVSSESRFSLGLEPNPDRSQQAFKVRQAIIDGIRLSYKEDGSIWLQNNMKWPVFVTSGYLDEQCSGLKIDKVHKVYGFAKLKVFGYEIVKDVIRDALFSRQMAALFLQGRKTPMDTIYCKKDFNEINKEAVRTVDSLQRFCCVRISFCKGFGESYSERPFITDCPVWIELKVNIAYDYMDTVLNELSNKFDQLEIKEFEKLGLDVSDD